MNQLHTIAYAYWCFLSLSKL